MWPNGTNTLSAKCGGLPTVHYCLFPPAPPPPSPPSDSLPSCWVVRTLLCCVLSRRPSISALAIVPRGMMCGSMVAATLIRRRGFGRKRWEGEGHRMGRLRDESGKGFSGRWPAPRFLQANPATIAAGAVISLCDEAVLEGWDYNGKPLSDGVAQQTRTDTKTLLHSLSVSVIYFLLKN